MENKLFEKSIKHLQIAEHLVDVTYKNLKEPKLLLSVLDNLFLALTNSITAVLEEELKYKRIDPYRSDFDSKIIVFEQFAKRKKLPLTVSNFPKQIKELILAHKKSAIEFPREDKYVICSKYYDIKTISAETLKTQIIKAKVFIEELIRLVNPK